MIKAIIAEDDPACMNRLTSLLEDYFPDVKILAKCSTVPEGVKAVNQLQPQLLFLDVELSSGLGFDLLEQTRGVNYEVIFTTAHLQYALQAIKFSTLDYLTKPVMLSDLTDAMERFKNVAAHGSKKNIDILLHNVKYKDTPLQQIGIPVGDGFTFVPLSEIVRCEPDRDGSRFFFTTITPITAANKPLKLVEELLTKDLNFFRCHESHLINLNHVKKYKKGSNSKSANSSNEGDGGTVLLTLSNEPKANDNNEIPVSRRKKDELLRLLATLK